VSVPPDSLTRLRVGGGEPLVLLHGLGLSWRAWKPVLEPLTAGFDVLALDLPGFGSAPPVDGEPTVGALADAVAAELDGAGLGAVAVAGNSLGGSVGLELARRRRASRVVVLGPAGMESAAERLVVITLNETQRAAYAAASPIARPLTGSIASRTTLLSWLHGRPWRLDAEDAAGEIRDFGRAPGFHATLRHATGTWTAETLAEIDVPVRICLGSRDPVIGPISAPRYVAALGRAELVPLPGCGHVPMVDDPELVAEVVAGEGPARMGRAGLEQLWQLHRPAAPDAGGASKLREPTRGGAERGDSRRRRPPTVAHTHAGAALPVLVKRNGVVA
jgi:pimeloyl-ACP methyl ester carboxylesterase